MFDIAWSEMALVAAVMLLVIGPKELPRVLRQMGIWMRKLRLLAGEFQRHLDDVVREADLDDVKRDIERVRRTDLNREMMDAIDPTGEVERSLRVEEEGPKLAKIPPAPEPAPEAPPEARIDISKPGDKGGQP